jgi:hypothetical protein
MHTVFSNPRMDDADRRRQFYGGQVLVYPAAPASLALVKHAQELIADAFWGPGSADRAGRHASRGVRGGAGRPEAELNTSGRTRFSIDFRTVRLAGVVSRGKEAPNIDSECTGATLRDFLRAADLVRMPEGVAQAHQEKACAQPEDDPQPTRQHRRLSGSQECPEFGAQQAESPVSRATTERDTIWPAGLRTPGRTRLNSLGVNTAGARCD